MNRLEQAPLLPSRYHEIGHDPVAIEALFVDLFLEAHQRSPKEIVLDLDATDDPLHGHQDGRFFHGCYDGYCYLPLYVLCGRQQVPAVLDKVGDKWETLQYARGLGIALPESFCPGSEEELLCLAAGWRGPAVIKPRMSSGSRGMRLVEAGAQLVDAYREVAAHYPRPIVQRRVPAAGPGLGVFALLDPDRRPLAIFGHRRLREYPITGGPSTLRESYRNEALIEQSLRLLRGMEMVGVAMVEYKVDPCSGQPLLMEVNPRFWGSLQLAVLAGVDFPVLYHKASLGMDVQPVLTYPEGVLCRWLWPGDLLHFLNNPQRFHLKPSFFQFRGMGDDILSARDPLPAIGMLLEGLRKLQRGAR